MRVEKQKETIDLDKLIDNITLQSPNPSKEHSAENSFSRLMARIQADSNSIDIFRRKASQYRVWLAAATVALLIAMSGWLYMMLDTDPSFIVTANNSGIVQHVILPDGSNIKLNNRSKLIYPEHFSKDSREVFLEGEAYFDVAPDKEHPLRTHP